MKYLTWNIGFAAFLVVVFIYGAIESSGFPKAGRYLPYSVALLGILVGLLLLVSDYRRWRSAKRTNTYTMRTTLEGSASESIPVGAVGAYAAVTVGYALGMAIVGTLVATAVFLFVLLRFDAKLRTISAVLATSAVLAVLAGLQRGIGLKLPEGLFF